MVDSIVDAYEVASALNTFFDPREVKIAKGDQVSFGFAWSVICEPHDHWNIRVALAHGGSLSVTVRHPGLGTTLDRVFAAGFNFGEILGLIGSVVPVKGESW